MTLASFNAFTVTVTPQSVLWKQTLDWKTNQISHFMRFYYSSHISKFTFKWCFAGRPVYGPKLNAGLVAL